MLCRHDLVGTRRPRRRQRTEGDRAAYLLVSACESVAAARAAGRPSRERDRHRELDRDRDAFAFGERPRRPVERCERTAVVVVSAASSEGDSDKQASRQEWLRHQPSHAESPSTAREAEWGREDSNLRRLSRRVYSPFPLATRAHPRGTIDSSFGFSALRRRAGLCPVRLRRSSLA